MSFVWSVLCPPRSVVSVVARFASCLHAPVLRWRRRSQRRRAVTEVNKRTMPPTSKKRKATAPTDGEGGLKKSLSTPPKEAPSQTQDVPGSPPSIPRLPPPVWGHVMDYMHYQDVRSALLVSKTMAREVTAYVHTLNIMESSQLDIPSARRFSNNVQNINILCLLRQTEDNYHDTISEDAARRISPFLSIFPILKRAFVGGALERPTGAGALPGQKIVYSEDMCSGPANRQEIFRALISSFIGAFKSRSLPNTLESLEGILNSGTTSRGCIKIHDQCNFCSQICRFFPFEELMTVVTELFRDDLCLKRSEILTIMQRRPGWTWYTQAKSEVEFLTFLTRYVHDAHLDDISALCQRLEEAGVVLNTNFEGIRYLDWDGLEVVDDLIKFGLDPNLVTKKALYNALAIEEKEGRQNNVFSKGTTDVLISRGFPLDRKDLVILDETKEPELDELYDHSCSL